jgi:acetyl esterase
MPLDPAAQQVLTALDEMGIPPFAEMTPESARTTFAAFRDLAPPGPEMASVEDRTVEGVAVRCYRPEGDGPLPVLVWFHGGGWVIGSVEESDATARTLADRAGVLVVSVEYHLAPEHPFPAAPDDCIAVTRWVLDHAGDIGGDASRVAVGGDSAGGNLAAVVAHALRGELRFQLLVYPATDATLSHPSIQENGEGYLLTEDAMGWFYGHYTGSAGVDLTDVRLSPLYNTDWSGLPPALVITAEFDPLRDEGEAYVAKLREAGVPADVSRYDGQIHGFFTLGALIPAGDLAVDEATTALAKALSDSER